jgi:hypothetical protein
MRPAGSLCEDVSFIPNRLLKKAHLRRWHTRAALRRTD